MRPRSNSLFHFTKNLDYLKAILKEGFWPRYCLEDVRWQGRLENEFVAFPMVCFCDIPISRLEEHVGFYGSFGIGLTKEWGAKNDLNPVMYFTGDNPLHGAIKNLTDAVFTLEDEEREKGLKDVRFILAHSKPIVGQMIVSGKPIEKEFYQESEWRYVPQLGEVALHLNRNDYDDEKILTEKHNKTSEFARLRFLPNDVRYIFVPKDSDIPGIMNFLQAELDSYPNADLKLLMSRVTSLESVSADV
jgi:hypothetical protein